MNIISKYSCIDYVKTQNYYNVRNIKKSSFAIPFSYLFPKAICGIHKLGYNWFNMNMIYSKKFLNKVEDGETKYLLRVDDFPRWDINSDEFVKFDSLMKEYQIPYILGVTPFLSFYKDEYKEMDDNSIRILKERNINFALHGFNHYNYNSNGRKKHEIVHYNDETLDRLIKKSIEFFKKNDLDIPDVFIPPFNTITYSNYMILSKYFKVITGGPATLRSMGEVRPVMGVYIQDSLYLASYYPYYGTSYVILNAVKKNILNNKKLIIPITIHWDYERNDNYANFIELLKIIKHNIVGWGEIQKDKADEAL